MRRGTSYDDYSLDEILLSAAGHSPEYSYDGELTELITKGEHSLDNDPITSYDELLDQINFPLNASTRMGDSIVFSKQSIETMDSASFLHFYRGMAIGIFAHARNVHEDPSKSIDVPGASYGVRLSIRLEKKYGHLTAYWIAWRSRERQTQIIDVCDQGTRLGEHKQLRLYDLGYNSTAQLMP